MVWGVDQNQDRFRAFISITEVGRRGGCLHLKDALALAADAQIEFV